MTEASVTAPCTGVYARGYARSEIWRLSGTPSCQLWTYSLTLSTDYQLNCTVVSYRHDTATHRCQQPKPALWSCGWNRSAWFCIHRFDSVKTAVPVCFAYDRIRRLCDHSSFGELHTPKSHDLCSQHQLLYSGWTAMALYVNFNAGVGKPLWEITLGEFVVWFKVRVASSLPMAPRS